VPVSLKKTKVFVLWDLSSNDIRVNLQALARRPPTGMEISFADPGKRGGNLLDEALIPGITSADRVLVIAPNSLRAAAAICFETGLAVGLNKPIALVNFRSNFLVQNYLVALLNLEAPPHTQYLLNIDELRKTVRDPDLWKLVALPPTRNPGRSVALCGHFGEGEALREELRASVPDWELPEVPTVNVVAELLGASKLAWIVTPLPESNAAYGDEWIIRESAQNALMAGFFYARSCSQGSPSAAFRVLRSRLAPTIRSVQRFESTFSDLDEFASLLRTIDLPDRPSSLMIERLEIRNFKNIAHLSLDFTAPSSLPGSWTCIAGINGAGKSSILQALCMLLLGEKLVAELGVERLRRMLRRAGSDRLDVELTAIVREGRETRTLYLPLSAEGIDRKRLFGHPEYSQMLTLWEQLQSQVLVAYGATRNLSDHRDTRYSSLSRHVQRQMTLFDPLTQVASVEVLLEGGESSAPVLQTLKALLAKILAGDLKPSSSSKPDRLLFRENGAEIEAIDLPDGFRSTVAWLADLCAAWHQTGPAEETADSDPEKIRGIVLIDEIDLHLHPSLQRELIPRLREALPNVQFFVTTHSPLVLSSFDRAELVVLDRDAEEGIRELDRQIFAFSTDQVYEWLMGTPPQSVVVEEKLSEGTDPNLPLYLYQSEGRSEDEARATLEERRRLLEELRSAKSES
jgi:predicted ATPase